MKYIEGKDTEVDWIHDTVNMGKNKSFLIICPVCKVVSIGQDQSRIHYALNHSPVEENEDD